jgi:hypothetical protein
MNLRSLITKCSTAMATLLLSGSLLHTVAQTNPCQQAPSCLGNGTFMTNGATGGDVNSSGPTTVNSWYVSHGSPSIGAPGPGGGATGIWMWSYSGMGEGIFSCYNFQAGHKYHICLWVQNTDSINLGNLMIYAANGLTGFGPTGTGVPTPSGGSELISNSFVWSPTWVQLSYDYTPTANYTQLWIYPYMAGPPINFKQYEMNTDLVSVFEVPLPVGYSVPCGGNIVLTAPTSTCVAYDWYGPTGTYLGAGTVIIPNADPTMSGIYKLVSHSGDCSESTPFQVQVQPCEPCDKFVPNFDILQGCNPVNFIETSSGPGFSVSWYWDFGDGTSSSLQNPSHTYAAAGTYTVCLTVIRKSGKETCCNKVCKDIKVCDPPAGGNPVEKAGVGFNFNYINATHQALKFSDANLTDQIICNYLWDFGDGTTSSMPNPAHVYSDAGFYTVTLTTKSCTYDASNQINSSKESSFSQLIKIAAANNAGEVEIIPNPAADQAVVLISNISNAKVVLTNMYGAEVATASASGKNRYTLNLEKLTSGVYLLTVEGTEGRFTKKLVKK